MARRPAHVFVSMAIVLCSFPSGGSAQARAGAVNPNAPHLMVGIFKNADKKLGPEAAEAIRDRIAGDVSTRDLYVIPKQDITNTLESSGYSTTDALSPADANALAKIIHADVYIEGVVTKTATGVQLEPYLMLQRDQNLRQPLGRYENAKLDGAASGVAREFKNAVKALEYEKNCRLKAREGKPAEALKAATDGIAAYPKSVWLRVCQLGIAVEQKKPAADIIKIAEEIRAVDPQSQIALKELVKQYDLAKNTDKKIEVLMELYRADSSNATLARQVVGELVNSGKGELARPIVEKAVASNPGDVALVQTYFNVLGALKDTKKMVLVGEEMVKMDTSLADADYFDRMVSAYATDSSYQKAAEVAARGTAKFPASAEGWLRLGNLQSKVGQKQQAIESLKKAFALDPKIKNAQLILVTTLIDMNQYDGAFAAAHEAVKGGEDADQVARAVSVMAKKAFDAANKAEPKTVAEFRKVLPYAAFADSIAKDRSIKNTANFLVGVSSYFITQLSYQEATKSKSCAEAKEANAASVDAFVNLPKGGASNPDLVKQLMPLTQQLTAASEQATKVFCKGENGSAKKPGRGPGH